MNDQWAYYWVNRYSWITERRADIDREDLFQAARLGIEAAEKAYTPERGSWATYSGYYIRNEFRRLIGHSSPMIKSLDEDISDDYDMTLYEVIPDESIPDMDETIIKDEMRQAVRDAVARLPDQHRTYIEHRYFEGLGQKETAELMHIKPTRAKDLYFQARIRLRRERVLREYSYDFKLSAKRFHTTFTSVVEGAVLRLETYDYRMKMEDHKHERNRKKNRCNSKERPGQGTGI